ncbi:MULTISPECIES: hypothetical protein [unclassified Blastococcus]|nr:MULTISPECIES: hypothetical protein [unclassified Blastococcus]
MTTPAEQQTTTGATTRVAPAGRRGSRPRRWTLDRIIAELNRGA